MRAIAVGDIHMELGNFAEIDELGSADLVIITGDLTNFGGQSEAATVIEAARALNPNLLALPGNLDQKEVGGYLTTLGLNLHGQGKIIQGVGFFGVGGSNHTPFHTPNEFSEAELAALLLEGYKQVQSATLKILVAHPPPFNTRTDLLANGTHVGSLAVRAFIEEYQPALCLTGHIHEATGSDQLGETLVINAGLRRTGGWVDIEIAAEQLTATLEF